MQNKTELQRRSYCFEARAEKDDQGGSIIVGRPIVYGQMTDLGWFDEIIERGALDKANLQDVRFLVNHDTSKIPLARSRKNNKNSTMQLTVTGEGMDIRGESIKRPFAYIRDGSEEELAALNASREKVVAPLTVLEKALKKDDCSAIIAALAEARLAADALEAVLDDKAWPLPKYREILFVY